MAGLSPLGHPKAEPLSVNELHHLPVTTRQCAMHPPSRHDSIRFRRQLFQPAIIIPTDGELHLPQSLGMGGSIGKQVGNTQSPVTPSPGKVHTTAHRRVVMGCIGGGRVQADEQDITPRCRIEFPPEGVSVLAAFR